MHVQKFLGVQVVPSREVVVLRAVGAQLRSVLDRNHRSATMQIG